MNVAVSTGRTVPWRRCATFGAVALAPFLVTTLGFESLTAAPSPTAQIAATPGGTLTGSANATVVDTEVTGPISLAGQTSTRIEARWSASEANLGNTSIDHPEGWTLEYTTDGSTWSPTPPSPLSLATGVRASGTVRSQGLDGSGRQISSKSSPGTALPVSGDIQGGVGGDGYGITFAGDRVLNVWHHATGTITIDCHLRATGAQCPRVVIVGPYFNGNHSTAAWEPTSQKLYTPVFNTSTNQFGFLCANYGLATPAACTTEFIAVSNTVNAAGGADLGGSTDDGRRTYVVNSRDNLLYCLDMVTVAPCTGFGLAGFTTLTHPGTWIGGTGWTSDLAAIGGLVYMTIGDRLGCVDPLAAPVRWCGGNQPIQILNNPQGIFNVPPFPVHDNSGHLQMVCEFMGKNCIDSNGVRTTMPTSLATFIGTTTIRNTYFLYSVFDSTVKENKLFWPVEKGGIDRADWANDVACFDFTTSAPCTGGDIPGVKYDVSRVNTNESGRIYVFAADPDPDISCIWVNSDSGVISTFSTELGSCSGNATIRFNYDEVVPRMSCSEPGRVREWRNLVISLPNGITASDLRLTIKDSSQTPQTIAGWNRTALTSVTVDLSSLQVSTTGTRPTFLLTAVNKTLQQVSGLTADLTYVSDVAQLCFDLVPVATCAAGQPTPSRTAVAPFTIDAVASAIGSSTSIVELSESVTTAMIDTSACPTGSVAGTATRARSGDQLAGVTVRLVNPRDGSTLSTTTTDANGTYEFTNLTEGSYRVEFGSVTDHTIDTNSVNVVVTSSATATAHATYSVVEPTTTTTEAPTPTTDAPPITTTDAPTPTTNAPTVIAAATPVAEPSTTTIAVAVGTNAPTRAVGAPTAKETQSIPATGNDIRLWPAALIAAGGFVLVVLRRRKLV